MATLKNERLKVENHPHLVRESSSHAIINADTSGYSVYMKRVRAREHHGDQIRNAVKEINTLKTELREIKNLLKEVVKNGS